MVGFDAENDDAIYHSSKFIEDVPLLIIAEIGRTQISVQKVLNLKKGNLVEFNKTIVFHIGNHSKAWPHPGQLIFFSANTYADPASGVDITGQVDSKPSQSILASPLSSSTKP